MTSAPSLEELARRAVDGDTAAVAALVRALQADVYSLALRMLWTREDAEDATQEILVRVVTRLSQFDFRSRLRTWVYRVAANYLLDVKKSPVERMHLTFARFAEDLAAGLPAYGRGSDPASPDTAADLARAPADGERSLLTEEVKIGCTMAMLQCLDRPHRLAYVLGEALELPGPEAAAALDIDPTAFRKRLERAREAVESFTRIHCGLASDSAACQCNRRVPRALKQGRIRTDRADFAENAASFDEARALVQRVHQARRALEVHRGSHPRASTVDFARRVVAALET
jgi:RNA polymerase sigma factor (sigma-70 family)